MKKQLIAVKGMPGAEKSPYKQTTTGFAFVSSPETGRMQITHLMTCREGLIREAWESVHNIDRDERCAPFDFSKLRLLIVHDPDNKDTFRRNLFSGKAALNLLEGINGWEKSNITTVKHPLCENAWLLTGPKEWLSQPQLLSAATWVLRLAAKNGPLNFDNLDTLKESFDRIYSDVKKGRTPSTSDNNRFLPSFRNGIFTLLTHYKEIFEGITFGKAWPKIPTDSYFGVYSGFYTLTDGDPDYSKEVILIQKRFRGMCKK